jgi:hypothetical protein
VEVGGGVSVGTGVRVRVGGGVSVGVGVMVGVGGMNAVWVGVKVASVGEGVAAAGDGICREGRAGGVALGEEVRVGVGWSAIRITPAQYNGIVAAMIPPRMA